MQTQEEMNVLVPEKLAEIERDYGVTVLWAVESGSRAWGFESPNSDFDVRFIYKHKQDFYLRLNEQRDVIELPIDDTWDVSGWDLDKTLKLLYKSNPTLFEWLQSPIIYQQTDFIERIRPLANQYFSEKKMLYHYLNTARTQMNKYLLGDKIKPKKYFYALRPILACRWIEKYRSVPPILFDDLVKELLPSQMKEHVSRLLDIKINGPEGMEIEPIKPIQDYILDNIQELDAYIQNVTEKKMLYHYLNTARTQMNKYLSGDKVKPKKYFYALRPILACRWIEKYHSVPPILFDDLVKELLPSQMQEHVSRLLDIKINEPEGMEIDPIMPIQDYILANIQELDAYVQSVREEKKDWKALNQFFLEELGHD